MLLPVGQVVSISICHWLGGRRLVVELARRLNEQLDRVGRDLEDFKGSGWGGWREVG